MQTYTFMMGQSMKIQWQAVLEKAIRDGNQVHDELFDQEGVIVTFEEGVELAGDPRQVRQIYQEYNTVGARASKCYKGLHYELFSRILLL